MTSSGDATTTAVDLQPPDLIGLLAVVGAGLLPVVFVDDLYYGAWAPKAALCLVLLLPGTVVLARLVVTGSRPARLAAAFLAVAALSTIVSDNPALSLVGAANWGTGLLFLMTLAGAWALGAWAGDRRRRQLVMAIIGAAVANAAVAWMQARTGAGGRTSGLMGNSVFLGALAAGALFLLGRRFGRERRSLWLLPSIGLVAGAAQLSGGRAAVVLAAAAVLASLPGAGRARSAALLAAVVVGVALAPLGAKASVLGSARAAPSGVVGGNDTRFAVWGLGVDAVRERPLLGWGPGRFAAATGPRYTASAARENVVLKDAHNWLVHSAVTTGLVGLALLLAWLGTAGWGARGPLAGFSVIIGASTLVQPLHIALTPIAMLALGAAGPSRTAEGELPAVAQGRAWAAVTATAAGAGSVAAVVLLLGQAYLQQGVQGNSRSQVERAASLSPPWPEVASAAAAVEATYGLSGSEPHRRRTIELSRVAAERDPADPAQWAELGAVELAWGSNARAATALRRALEADPWHAKALLTTVTLARRQGDDAALAQSCRRLRRLGQEPPACAP